MTWPTVGMSERDGSRIILTRATCTYPHGRGRYGDLFRPWIGLPAPRAVRARCPLASGSIKPWIGAGRRRLTLHRLGGHDEPGRQLVPQCHSAWVGRAQATARQRPNLLSMPHRHQKHPACQPSGCRLCLGTHRAYAHPGAVSGAAPRRRSVFPEVLKPTRRKCRVPLGRDDGSVDASA